ncbi:hypothetical protein ABIA33_001110 [Streptacidiphilus sp. MAP12-16]|uniref:hypothetical protein n=1 Tax=Streptacidiphilus sp. MAP12-16 TaxID=3156300 RepID=UPI0035150BCE
MAELAASAGFGEPLEVRAIADGWQVVEFGKANELGPMVSVLAQATGTPTIAAMFLDSDCGFVHAATPDGRSWEALLDRAMCEEYEAPLDRFPVERAVSDSLAWSAAAGLTPDQEVLTRALTDSMTFAESLFSVLLVGLGIPGSELPNETD